jgi:phospholipase D1/2
MTVPSDTMSRTPILAPGRNCWTENAAVEACGLLVDAREYYRALYHAARRAKRYIYIAGWKFNSDVRLLRGEDAEEAGEEAEFLPFLKRLCEENRDLRIYILAWNYSFVFSWEWEWNLTSKFSDADGRMQFRFDSEHAVVATHHQKFVVVDGHVAFVGGLDINRDDWDDRDHRLDHPSRVMDVGEDAHPYHDIQSVLVGPVAQEVARYFKTRWDTAGHEPFEIPEPIAFPYEHLGIPIKATRAALSRNQPMTLTNSTSILEIRQLYLDAIAAAEESIYIENQYFTSHAVADALIARMRQPDRPTLEIVVILPRNLPAMTESVALEPLRLRLLDTIPSVARETGHRLGIYYSAAGSSKSGVEIATLIHSKLMTVDDRFLTIGSANTSNRSMELDTELNVTWEATGPQDAELMASIRAARANLLAEHCGKLDRPEVLHNLERTHGLVEYLDQLAREPGNRLQPLNRDAILRDQAWLAQIEKLGLSFDPDGPIVEQLL